MSAVRLVALGLVGLAVLAARTAPVGADPSGSGGSALRRFIAKYNGPAGGGDLARAIAVAPDGARVFVTGKTYDRFGTVAYDRGVGGQLWSATLSGPGEGYEEGRSVGVSPGGDTVYVAGYSVHLSDQRTGAVTIAYDAATGARRWIAVEPAYPGASNSIPLAVSPTGAFVFVATYVSGASSGGDFDTIAYDARTGTRVWSVRFSGPGQDDDLPTAIAVSGDGELVYVSGFAHSQPGDQGDYVTLAYEALTGTRQWMATFTGPGDFTDTPAAVAVRAEGSAVYVTGTSEDGYATLAYDSADGSELWTAIYDPYQRVGSDATALAMDPGGEVVYVTGGAGRDYGTVAYDASTGAQLWDSIYTGGNGDDEAQAIGVSPDGTRVYVTGRSQGSNGYFDYATVAYSAATGTKLGVDRYDGPAHQHDEAWDLAVGSDGWLYVTGNSFIGYTRYDDYVTIAYGP